MMERIKSFFRDEQDNKDNERVQAVTSTQSSSSSTPPPLLSRDTVLLFEEQAAVNNCET